MLLIIKTLRLYAFAFNNSFSNCCILLSVFVFVSCGQNRSSSYNNAKPLPENQQQDLPLVLCQDIYPPASLSVNSCLTNLSQEFKSPPLSVYPAVYWTWNGEMDEEKMAFQIEDMKITGYSTAIVFPYKGIPFSYLSETWFEKIRIAAKLCRDHGLKLWVIDDGSFPTGFVNGAVTDNYPEYRQQKISQMSRYILHKNIPFEYASDENIKAIIARRIDTDDYQIIDLTTKLKNGKLTWSSQPFSYEISVYAMQPTNQRAYNIYTGGSQYGHSSVPDYLNSKVTDMFIELTYKPYRAKLSDFIPGTFEGIMSDESGMGKWAWTKNFLKEFEERKGYDLAPYLPLLFDPEEGVTSMMVNFDYRDVCSQLFMDNFHRPRMEACIKAGWKCVFQPDKDDDDFIATNHSTGDLFNVNRIHTMPTLDVIWRQIWYGSRNDFPKLPSSVAHLYGRTDVLSEIMAAFGFGTTTSHLKWVSDYQIVRGVNRFAMHMYNYAGDEWRTYHIPPDFSPENYPLRVNLKLYNDYLARMNVIFQATQAVSGVALYYPREASHAVNTPEVFSRSHEIARLLLEHQIDFTWIDSEALLRCEISDGRLISPGGMAFDAVIISRQACFPEDAWNVLKTLAKSWGNVFVEKNLPLLFKRNGMPVEERVKPAEDKGISIFNEHPVLIRELSGRITPAVKPDRNDPYLRIMVRENKDEKYLACFVFNEGNKRYTGKLEITDIDKDLMRIEEWNPADGCVYPVKWMKDKNKLFINLELYPGATRVFFICRNQDPLPSYEISSREKVINLKQDWRVNFMDGTETLTMKRLCDWKDTGRETFSGTAVYKTAFELPRDWKGKTVMLDLGQVQHSADVIVNDTKAASLPWPPFACYISDAVNPGKNILVVKVTNTLSNRFMNQEAVEKARQNADLMGTYIEKYSTYDMEMMNSGLRGPVRLVRVD